MTMGRILGESGHGCEFEMSTSRRILVCGKTGTGKSYTLGVLVEELALTSDLVCLIVDPQGIFWTMGQPNYCQHDALSSWGLLPRHFDVNLLLPGKPEDRLDPEVVSELRNRNVNVREFRLNPSDLSEEMWCDLFGLSINELQGSALFKCVRRARQKLGKTFLIPDIMAQVELLKGAAEVTKEALLRKLEMATDWSIFQETSYIEIWDYLRFGSVNVLDLSALEPTRYGLRTLIVGVLGRYLFRQRVTARRREELDLPTSIPRIWLAIDEAHNFCPSGSSTHSKEVLVRWAKEGRQPGLSLVVATQQPSAVDREIVSQCDLIIAHKLTNKDDRRVVLSLAQDYMDAEVGRLMSAVERTGEAVVLDDLRGVAHAIAVRPRLTQHGGSSR